MIRISGAMALVYLPLRKLELPFIFQVTFAHATSGGRTSFLLLPRTM